MPSKPLTPTVRRVSIAVAALLVIILIVALIQTSKSMAQLSVPGWWTQLGYDPYHTSFIPRNVIVGNFSNTIYRVWSFIMPAREGQMGFNMNPLIADVDNDGFTEVVAVDAGGRVIVLYGSDVPGLDTNNFTTIYKLIITVNASLYSTPALADVDGDNVLEAIIGCRDGYLRCVDLASGTIEWEQRVGINIASSPLVYDIDRDGVIDIVVSTANATYRINSVSGEVLWKTPFGRGLQSAASPVLLDDINNDGTLDIAVTNLWGYIFVIDGATGQLIKSIDLWRNGFKGLFITHSPVSADINGDNYREIIVSAGIELIDTTTISRVGYNGSIIVVDPRQGSIITFIDIGSFAWHAQPSIAAADVDNDGMAEIFIASIDGYLYRLDYSNGSLSISWQYQYDTYWPAQSLVLTSHAATISVADINNDTSYEVVLITPYYTLTTVYRLYVIDVETGSSITIYDVMDKYTVAQYAPFTSTDYDAKATMPSLSIADVDGDNALEIIVTSFQVVSCLDAG
ncbi:hypothetical protein Pyrde_0257 [Pyrodictium delaneyi]|uniref:Lambda-carrageenase beta-propeller domain-containing protein n=1 Tax=Pyrodictium delaneyi TaxID=1273541 RepID=A0A0P0N2H1_9CREN|nr:FG-GAP-like repeat-containing protein [Pyrodictium delaneyi]ALL00307.1 hypothetical protein Pyrde_0257 [Pyrodictium delaneyi]OWJ54375.1 hypothetical protein Pdsh_07840 [Pyrodictium delaneyi]